MCALALSATHPRVPFGVVWCYIIDILGNARQTDPIAGLYVGENIHEVRVLVDTAVELIYHYCSAIEFRPHWVLIERVTRRPLRELYHWQCARMLWEVVTSIGSPECPRHFMCDLVAMQLIAAALFDSLLASWRLAPPWRIKVVVPRLSREDMLRLAMYHGPSGPWVVLLHLSLSDCAWCRRSGRGSVCGHWGVCKRCRIATRFPPRYCSRKCQKKDWKYGHRSVCPLNQRRGLRRSMAAVALWCGVE